MTISMSRPTLESTIHGLVRLYWSNQASSLAASKAEVATVYWQRAIREGIAAILFQHRADALPRFNTVPVIYESDVNAILRKHEKDYTHGSGVEKPMVLDAIYQQLIELSVPQDLIETDEAERKRRVLDGEEPALPSDEKWIMAMAEEKRREVEEIIALLQPITKVNDAPRKRTQPKCVDCELKLSTFDDKGSYIEHLRKDHDYTEIAASRYGSDGWSRQITWLQSEANAGS